MQIREYFYSGIEPEIQISDGQIDVSVLHDRIKILCDISGCGSRLCAGMDIKLDDFLDACNRLKAEIAARSIEEPPC